MKQLADVLMGAAEPEAAYEKHGSAQDCCFQLLFNLQGKVDSSKGYEHKMHLKQ